jgi:hypothetical protein
MNRRLCEVVALMKEYEKKGYNVYFEGQGDGNVKAIVEAIFIEDKNRIKQQKNKK